MLSGESTNINFIVCGLTPSGLEPTIYALEASTLTVMPPMQFSFYLESVAAKKETKPLDLIVIT